MVEEDQNESIEWTRAPACSDCGAPIRRTYQGFGKKDLEVNPDGSPHAATCTSAQARARLTHYTRSVREREIAKKIRK